MVSGVFYPKPRRSAKAPEACFSALQGSGTAGPAGKLAHSAGHCWYGLKKTKINKYEQTKMHNNNNNNSDIFTTNSIFHTF